MIDPTFYKGFDEKYRGSRSLIKSRRQVYLPYIQGIATAYPRGKAIDLACARGEWTEQLFEAGLDPVGVDADRSYAEICKQRGLKAKHAEPVVALQSLDAASELVVSGFNLVEYLSFDQLQELLGEANRVLKVDGILILETYNPEYCFVDSKRFYLDPRAYKPIPPELLTHLLQHIGFTKIKILYLNAQQNSDAQNSFGLLGDINQISPVYAVVAQKTDLNVPQRFDIEEIESTSLTQPVTFLQVLERQLIVLKTTTEDALKLAQDSEEKLNYIHRSLSWRLTRPLRWLDHQSYLLKKHGLIGRVKAFFDRAMTSFVNRCFNFSIKRPGLNKTGAYLVKCTGLHSWFCTYLVKTEAPVMPATLDEEAQAYKTDLRLDSIDSDAREIYSELSHKIQSRKGFES